MQDRHKERRKFIRHPSEMAIEYQESSGGNNGVTNLNNIGWGGLSFRSLVQVDVGIMLNIKIPIHNTNFSFDGQVVWCKPAEQQFDVGVQFINADDNHKTRMVEQVCYIEQYKQTVLKKEGRNLTSKEAAVEWIQKYSENFP